MYLIIFTKFLYIIFHYSSIFLLKTYYLMNIRYKILKKKGTFHQLELK